MRERGLREWWLALVAGQLAYKPSEAAGRVKNSSNNVTIFYK